MTVTTVSTKPFEGQKPGTSGLRKKVPEFQQKHYLENFIQSTFNAVREESVGSQGNLEGSTLVVGGDGRYYCAEASQIIIKMAQANGVAEVIIGVNGILSTPAVSALVRRRNTRGGIILTASHNPGGPNGDFGVKYNIGNGGPAPESVTSKIFQNSKEITEYKITDLPDVDLSAPAKHTFDSFAVTVVDPVEEYTALMKELFDFEAIKKLLAGGFKILIDCMHGVAGPYATHILVNELGAPPDSVVNNVTKEDFGGGHPDPNLTYAKDLVDAMKNGDADFGAAFDGDADRNMILGKKAFFVTPSDSVAVIAANHDCIPYFKREGLKGLSRSMPTGAALDHVAKKLNVEFFEVPTGWKFFGNLMDANRLSICGEESFGTGSNHIREKDGVWAVLCWLSILASKGTNVEDVMMAHWQEFGRNFFTRYDYEGVTSEAGASLMAGLGKFVESQSIIGKKYSSGHTLKSLDNFEYTDATNGEVTSKQGIRFIFDDGSRIIFRLSGTGSAGATIRLYVDSYVNISSQYKNSAQDVLKPLVDVALEISSLQELTGRNAPTVIT
eukprot:m.47240 g.47240  ORF g.47240 m.47240 type:complete len:556 (-) comp10470_c0_seq2:300-1967(-)